MGNVHAGPGGAMMYSRGMMPPHPAYMNMAYGGGYPPMMGEDSEAEEDAEDGEEEEDAVTVKAAETKAMAGVQQMVNLPVEPKKEDKPAEA